MIVCHCEVVSDRDIRAAIDDGAHDRMSVADRCGAGRHCLGCAPSVEALLEDAALALRAPDSLRGRQLDRRRALVASSVA
jgi:bacterioferritin-associated ferredoxin